MIRPIVGTVYKFLLRPILFLLDPETVHDLIAQTGSFLGKFWITKFLTRKLFSFQDTKLSQTISGITFRNPVGLSAGFDKDANLVNILPDVGFGYMQVGTVTLKPYKGNPKPRLVRLPKSKGIIVNYGLKNIGITKVIAKLKKRKEQKFPLSISVGKTNSPQTAKDRAGINDYSSCLNKIIKSGIGDFYTINISCPNTFGGEPFTTPSKLTKLLKKLYSLEIDKPLFIKMPINDEWPEFKRLLEVAIKFRVTGVIIGNLNKDHKDASIKDSIPSTIKGGVSGKPTWKLSNGLISKTYKAYGKKLVIVGVGGVFSANDAYEKIKKGASLVQLITGMIYEGPQLIGEINRGVSDLLKKDGFENISEAIGKK